MLPAVAAWAAATLASWAVATAGIPHRLELAVAFGLFWLLLYGVGRRAPESDRLLLPSLSTFARVITFGGAAATGSAIFSAVGVEPLRTTCGSSDAHVRWAALSALGRLASLAGAAVIEEAVFRAWLPKQLERVIPRPRTIPRWWMGLASALLSQLAFSLAHLPGRAMATGEAVPQIGALVAPFLKGLTLVALARASGGISMPAIAHWAHNWFLSSAAPLERSCAGPLMTAGCLSAVVGALVLIYSRRRAARP